jgi:hypothetical protein
LPLLNEEAQRLPNPRLVRTLQSVGNNMVISSTGGVFEPKFAALRHITRLAS